MYVVLYVGFHDGSTVKNLPAMQEIQEMHPWVEKILWRSKWQPTPVFLPGKFHGKRSLGGLQYMGPQRVVRD